MAILLGMFLNNLRAAQPEEKYLDMEDLGLNPWLELYDVRTPVVGYDDNVLLTDADKKGSGFVENGADATFERLPITSNWELRLSLDGDDRRYWRGNTGVDHEDLWSLIAEADRDFTNGWKFQARGLYSYSYQVVEVLLAQGTNRAVQAPIQGHMLTFRPTIEKEFGEHWLAGLQIEGTREFVTAPADSFFRYGPTIKLAYGYGWGSEIALSYTIQQQLYDHLMDLDQSGGDTTGGSLRMLKQEGALGWKHVWGPTKRWQTGAKLDYASWQDNGSGYYNYHDYQASAEVRFHTRKWDVTCSGNVEYLNFPIQDALTLAEQNLQPDASNPPKFRQTLFLLNFRAERHFTKWLSAFADYGNDTSLSDSVDQVWHANTIKGGLEWAF